MHSTDLIHIAERFGTPLYIYDLDLMAARADMVRSSVGRAVEILYAVKANPNPTILSRARNWADGLDISSGGELKLGLENG